MAEVKPIYQQAFPEPAVGVLVYNEQGEILLARGPKFGELWCIPGGHIEVGETAEQSVRREIKEELGCDVDNIVFLEWMDAINPDFYHKQAHFLFLDFAARYSGGGIKLDQAELIEYKWFMPAEALKQLKINSYTIRAINKFIENQRETEADEYKNNWQRALADYQNLKKETEARRSEWAQYSEQMILEEFIPVYEHLKLAINNEQLANNKDPWLQGVRFVAKQFDSILKAHNVQEIKTIGEIFDPKLHESVAEEEAEGKKHGTILREIDGGYTMGGRVIKVAKVTIAK